MLRLGSTFPLWIAALVTALWHGCVFDADDGKTPPAASAAPGLTAEQILEKAIERQGSAKLPTVVQDCRSELQVTLESEKKRFEGQITEVYQRTEGGGRIKTTYVDAQTKGATTRAFDGKKYRSKSGDEAAVDLVGRDYEQDRREIDDDRATIRLVLDLLSLRSTTGPNGAAWTRLPDGSVGPDPAFVLERRDGPRPVRLCVSPGDFRVLAVELPPTEKDPRKQQFRMFETDKSQKAVLETVTVGGQKMQGLRLPRVIKLYVNDQGEPPTSDVWIKSIALDTGVSPDEFSLK